MHKARTTETKELWLQLFSKIHHTIYFFYLFPSISFVNQTFWPVHVWRVSHAFNPSPAEPVQPPHLILVEGHMDVHLPDVSQWRKQITELRQNLLHGQEIKNIQVEPNMFTGCIEVMHRKDHLWGTTGSLTDLHRVSVVQAFLKFMLHVLRLLLEGLQSSMK